MRFASVVIALALVAACGTASTADPSAPVTTLPLATSRAVPTSAAVPTSRAVPTQSIVAASQKPEPSADAREWPRGPAVPLDQGIYAVAPPFDIPFTIDVPPTGWFSAHTGHKDFVDLTDADRIGVPPTGWIAFAHPAQLDGENGPVEVESVSASSAAEMFANREDLRSGPITTVHLAGLTGAQLDVAATESQAPLFGGPGGHFQLDPSYDARLAIFPVENEGLLLVIVLALKGHLDSVTARAQPILDSIKF